MHLQESCPGDSHILQSFDFITLNDKSHCKKQKKELKHKFLGDAIMPNLNGSLGGSCIHIFFAAIRHIQTYDT